MMKRIFYFSGTGNSFAVARDIAVGLDAKLSPVLKMGKCVKADMIGFVFPVYDFMAPRIVSELIRKTQLDPGYIFAVATYGIRPLNTLKRFGQDIDAAGGRLSAGFAVHMPHNALGHRFIQGEREKLLLGWEKRRAGVIEYLRSRRSGRIETSSYPGLLPALAGDIPSLAPILWQGMRHGWESLKFKVDEKCKGCGTCVKVCPVENIKIKGKPEFSDKCVSCFACINWCPKGAINISSLTKGMRRYHHPDVKLRDLI